MKIRIAWIIALFSALFIGQASARASADATTPVVTTTKVVHCVSGPSGRTYCGATHTHYTISGTPDPRCVEGKTWGLDDQGVWVMNGCVADFSPVIEDNTSTVTTTSQTQTVTCTSTGDGRTYCSTVPNRHYLLQKIRAGNCVEGQTWGIDEHGLWVSGGCSGDFDDQD